VEASEAIRRELQQGRAAALVTVTGLVGEPPSRPGLRLAVAGDGSTAGTLGCDGFDRAGRRDGLEALRAGSSSGGSYRWDDGSSIEVEVEVYSPGDEPRAASETPEVLIVGGGPVASALAQLASAIGYRVKVAARDQSGLPEGFDSVVTELPATVADLVSGPATYVVICGHDEEFSQPALEAILGTEAAYIGMMGSQRHTGHLYEALRGAEHTEDSLARVHSPVGLDIGSETPEEIALSALAEVVARRRGRPTRPIASS